MRLRGTLLLDLTMSPEELLGGVERKRRQDIATHLSGIEISETPNTSIREEWTDLLLEEMSSYDMAPERCQIEDYLKLPSCHLFVATRDGELVSGELFNMDANAKALPVGSKRAMRLLYSATRKDAPQASKIHAKLVWQTILRAKELGYTEYDFGGWNCFRPDQAGVNSWKMKFGGCVWWMQTSGTPPLEQVLEEKRALDKFDPSKAVIWFDDGHVSVHRYGLEFLNSMGLKAILALVTGRVGKRLEASSYANYEIMNEKQLNDLIDAGWEIASHGVTHRSFQTLSLEEAEWEFAESLDWITDNLGVRPTKFAAPYSFLTSEQRAIAKRYYGEVRPNLPPRPPQAGGIHAIFHQVLPNPAGVVMHTAVPTDPPLMAWIRTRLDKRLHEYMKRPEAAADLNLSTNSTPKATNFYENYRGLQPAEASALGRYLKPRMKILELGAGGGRITEHLTKFASVTVSDYSPKMVEVLKQLGYDASVIDAADIPFLDNQFDAVVFSFNGLDEISPETKRIKALREIHRVLKMGGRLIMSSHNMEWAVANKGRVKQVDPGYFEYWTPYGFLIIRFISEEDQLKQLQESGFDIIEVEPHEKAAPWIYYVAEKDVVLK